MYYHCRMIEVNSIILKYKELKNIWKVGEFFGITGQKVHFILNKNGISTKRQGEWNKKELAELKELYTNKFLCGDDRLLEFCKKIGKLKPNVCRKAKNLGLTSKHRNFSKQQKERIVKQAKEWHKNNEHPRGMLGKTHTEEVRKILSKASKERWADPNSYLNSKEYRQIISDRQSKEMVNRLKNNPANQYSRVKRGTVEIGGKTFFARSSWEANIGAYFEFLKQNNEILDWIHEPQTFWFEEIRRGIRSYKPDFKITNKDKSEYFVEVKGWMDKKSATKLKRMKIYYPKIKIEVLGEKRYKSIKKMCSIIPNWGLLDSDVFLPKISICSLDGCENKCHSKGYCRKHFYTIYGK